MRNNKEFRMTDRSRLFALLLIAPTLTTAPAKAQDGSETGEKRTRIILGPQLSPSWPGSKDFSVTPYIDASRTRESAFEFEAPDESFGQPLVHSGNFAFGPAFGFIGKRKASDIGADLPKVGFTAEAGGFAGDEEDVVEAEGLEGAGFGEDFVGVEGLATDGVLGGETAVGADVGADVGEVERCVELHRAAEALHGELLGAAGELLKVRRGGGGEERGEVVEREAAGRGGEGASHVGGGRGANADGDRGEVVFAENV